MFRLSGKAVVFCAAMAASASAQASQFSILVDSDSIPAQTTSWNQTLTVDMFDTNLGALESIELEFTGLVEGSARFESTDPTPTIVTTTLSALVNLRRPDNSLLLSTSPNVVNVTQASAYDGVTDFGGTSGATFLGLADSDIGMVTYTQPIAPADFNLFAAPGGGTISFPVSALGTSNATGSGNLIVQFMTRAGADLTVRYTYKVPEPGTLALLALGTSAGLRRRRKATR